MRCPRCGCNNMDDVQTCWRCGLRLTSHPNASSSTSLPSSAGELPSISSYDAGRPPHELEVRSQARSMPTSSRVTSLWQILFPPEETIVGTVVAVEPVHEEPRERNWLRLAVAISLLLGLILLLFGALLSYGLFLAIAFIFLLILLFKFIRPGGIFQAFFLFHFLNPFHRSEHIPVQYFRVRDRQQGEYIVRMKGRLEGHIMPGDEVEVRGQFHDGILHLRDGRNLRTRSLLKVHP
jgi:hypothetical protein